MTSSAEPTVESLSAEMAALQGDVDIFWLMFGAILVFCEYRARALFSFVLRLSCWRIPEGS